MPHKTSSFSQLEHISNTNPPTQSSSIWTISLQIQFWLLDVVEYHLGNSDYGRLIKLLSFFVDVHFPASKFLFLWVKLVDLSGCSFVDLQL